MSRLPQISSRLLTRNSFNPTTTTGTALQTTRHFSRTTANMGVEKTIISAGSGAIPKKGDKVTMEYTGWLKDTSKPGNKGKQ